MCVCLCAWVRLCMLRVESGILYVTIIISIWNLWYNIGKYHDDILNVIKFHFNSGKTWRRQDKRAAWSGKSVQLALLWYAEACWECQVVDCFTTLHTILDAIYSTCVSIFIGSKQKPQSFDLWSSLHVLHLFGNLWIAFNFPLSVSNLESTSSGDHQRNLTTTQATSLMIVR